MKMPELRNRINKDELKVLLAQEKIERITFSFYKYVKIDDPKKLRDNLFISWTNLNCFGRIYVAHEGINAQMNVPEDNWGVFVEQLNKFDYFKMLLYNYAWPLFIGTLKNNLGEHWNGNLEKIKEYCEGDVEATMNVMLKISGLGLLQKN